MNHKQITVALAGNPNCGKTAIFNLLTGSRQRVGNWPGVTVEKKTGQYSNRDCLVNTVDLPGVYSLSATDQDTSIDEQIACHYLSNHNVDCLINIVDGAHLERNLYLTLQLLEMKIPMIIVVNMMDLVNERGIALDLKKLQKTLNCPVISMIANRGEGLETLREAIDQLAKKPVVSPWTLPLSSELKQAVSSLQQSLLSQSYFQQDHRTNWLALGLLSGDVLAKKQVNTSIIQAAEQQMKYLSDTLHEDTDILIADARYGFINQLVSQITVLPKSSKRTITQQLDRIVLNRFLGIPIFLCIMYIMFLFSINVGGAFQDFFDISSTTLLVEGLAHGLLALHFPVWFVVIIANGFGKGVNTVVTFIPVIGAMFLFLSFLEDSGYMARAAFVMDRLMFTLGLPGKSFVPMIVGFGCNVPAVMGARTLSNPRDRVLTVMMMPFMSCSARLAIFSVFASAFFQQGGQDIIFILYVTGIAAAIFTAFMLRKTILSGQPSPLVMELPPYHVPRLNALCIQSWIRLKSFIFRAGRVIVPVCVLIGILNSVTLNGSQQSVLSVFGREMTPILSPIGIKKDNWPATMGLVTGVLAKEVVVGTLNTLYSQAGHMTHQESKHFDWKQGLHDALASIPANVAGLVNALKNPFAASTPNVDMNHTVFGVMAHYFDGKIGVFSYLLFVLLYFPCVATMTVIRRELDTKWAIFSVSWNTGLAFGLATLVYQTATVLQHPEQSLMWIAGIATVFFVIITGLNHYDFTRR